MEDQEFLKIDRRHINTKLVIKHTINIFTVDDVNIYY